MEEKNDGGQAKKKKDEKGNLKSGEGGG